MSRTLYDKIWDEHVIRSEDDGTAVLYIDRHLVHEVTSPQAFEGLELAGRKVWRVSANLAVSDHNVPTTDRSHGIADPISRLAIAQRVLSRTGAGGCNPIALWCPIRARSAGHARATAGVSASLGRVAAETSAEGRRRAGFAPAASRGADNRMIDS